MSKLFEQVQPGVIDAVFHSIGRLLDEKEADSQSQNEAILADK